MNVHPFHQKWHRVVFFSIVRSDSRTVPEGSCDHRSEARCTNAAPGPGAVLLPELTQSGSLALGFWPPAPSSSYMSKKSGGGFLDISCCSSSSANLETN